MAFSSGSSPATSPNGPPVTKKQMHASPSPVKMATLKPTPQPVPAKPAVAARPGPAGKQLRLATVVSQFVAEADGDLSLQIGQVVVLTKARPDKQWWKGYVQNQPARKGVFPKQVRARADILRAPPAAAACCPFASS